MDDFCVILFPNCYSIEGENGVINSKGLYAPKGLYAIQLLLNTQHSSILFKRNQYIVEVQIVA
jgi:hypothetical protein